MSDKVNILGVYVDKFNISDAASAVFAFTEAEGCAKAVYTPNSEIIMQGYRSEEICKILNSADLLTADGIGVVYASKILGEPVDGRCAGFDVACSLLEKMGKAGKSVYLFGSKPGVAEKAAENIGLKYPGIKIAGCADGYFDSEKEAEIINDINSVKPDVLFVCLGAPKQEKWIYENKNKLNCKVCMGLGGSLDVFAGTVNRAPEFYQKHGLEWFYRLVKQPGRFFRMLDLPKFAVTVLIKGKKFKQDR